MAKLILMSILLATVLVPLRTSRDPRPVRGLRRTVLLVVAFNVVYLLLCVVVYNRL